MTFQHFEQLYQCQRWFGFPVFVTRKRIDSAPEDFSGFPLIERKSLTNACDEFRIDDSMR